MKPNIFNSIVKNLDFSHNNQGTATDSFLRLRYFSNDYTRSFHIQPTGYWSEVITVIQQKDLNGKWENPSISYSSGGWEKGYDEITILDNFAKGLTLAKNIFKRLNGKKTALKRNMGKVG